MSDRTTSIHINGCSHSPHPILHWTPQGSPLSPILSALYTAPLLHLAECWHGCSAQFYVDDGALIAVADTHEESTRLIGKYFEFCMWWLHLCGLAINPGKTEFLTFWWPG
jgi:hypothetical protein